MPDRSSSGSYVVTATSGSGQPPVLGASTTFHVNGITIVAVPTPTAQASPTLTASPTVSATAAAAATVTTSSTPVGQVSAIQNTSATSNGSGLILPLALGGLLLIVAALVAGVLFVRHQRELAAAATAAPDAGIGGGPVSPNPIAMVAGAAFPYNSDGIAGKPTLKRPSLPNSAGMQGDAPVPFDPGLAEAMRQIGRASCRARVLISVVGR